MLDLRPCQPGRASQKAAAEWTPPLVAVAKRMVNPVVVMLSGTTRTSSRADGPSPTSSAESPATTLGVRENGSSNATLAV